MDHTVQTRPVATLMATAVRAALRRQATIVTGASLIAAGVVGYSPRTAAQSLPSAPVFPVVMNLPGLANGNDCDADLDNNCFVNFGDLAALNAVFSPRPYHPDADFNEDGFVNFGDLAFMKSTFLYGTNAGPGPAAPGNDRD